MLNKFNFIYQSFSPGLRLVFGILAFLLAGAILVISLSPAQPSLAATHMDKVGHVTAYLLLGGLTLPALSHLRPLVVWVCLVLFGGAIELFQGLMNTGRSADLLDGVANGFGALLAILFWAVLSKLLR